jgi:ElaB/YqjD/DUF883 family membrane-anchored ribosome-binding protein
MNHNHEGVEAIPDHVRGLAQDARALMAATADLGGEQVAEARKRVASALEHGKDFFGDVQDQVRHEAREIGACAHRHPYRFVGVALGLGAILGILMMPRR